MVLYCIVDSNIQVSQTTTHMTFTDIQIHFIHSFILLSKTQIYQFIPF